MQLSARSLFHFTPRFDALKGILATGFRYARCTEELPISGYSNSPFSIPGLITHTHDCEVVCFCDLRLHQSEEHRAQYGQYAIALTKDWGMRNGITPVRYAHFGSPDFTTDQPVFAMDMYQINQVSGLSISGLIVKMMTETSDAAPTPEDFERLSPGMKGFIATLDTEYMALLNHFRRFMPLVRLYQGEWHDRSTGETTLRTFYDEREWRALMPDGDSANLQFEFSDVVRLIVKSEEERDELLAFLSTQTPNLNIASEREIWSKVVVADDLHSDV